MLCLHTVLLRTSLRIRERNDEIKYLPSVLEYKNNDASVSSCSYLYDSVVV